MGRGVPLSQVGESGMQPTERAKSIVGLSAYAGQEAHRAAWQSPVGPEYGWRLSSTVLSASLAASQLAGNALVGCHHAEPSSPWPAEQASSPKRCLTRLLAKWKSGLAILGYGQAYESTIIGFGPNPKSKYIALL
jgi:hypothetical protein